MKYLSMFLILALGACLMSGCASTGSTTAGGDPVPGEKVSDEGRLQPGTAGASPNASVKW
jgi:uncharacterized protein YceK